MGRQWLQAKRLVVWQKKSQANGKLIREIVIAAKMGGGDPDTNAHLAAAIEKARRENVTRDAIERAIKKGSGVGTEKMMMDQVNFEGYAPHKVPVIVEAYTDNPKRTAPEIRVLFRQGQLGGAGSNRFLFDRVGLVEAYREQPNGVDLEEVAIEAGANEVTPLSFEQNDDIPEGALGAKFTTECAAVSEVSKWLTANGWKVITSEIGYQAKNYPDLTDEQKAEVGEFLQALEDHDDVHRVWAAIK